MEETAGRIIREFGETVTLARDGNVLGRGRAILRPVLTEETQFVPTRLGVRRVERVLCLGEAGLPFPEDPDGVILTRGAERYDVGNVRLVTVGREAAYWRAALVRRDPEEVIA
jgi:hypothetical protein